MVYCSSLSSNIITPHFSFHFSNKCRSSNNNNNITVNVKNNNTCFSSSSSLLLVPFSNDKVVCGAIASKQPQESEAAIEDTKASVNNASSMPKIDKSGRFCSPRSARELALTILYAACLQGSDPIRLFDQRLNAKREPGYEFNKDALLEYNHMSFGGPPVLADTLEQENDLLRINDQQSATEAEILSAPPKLVYSKLVLRFTRKLLVAVLDKWDSHVAAINRVVPPKWQTQPASKILELSILHLAMAEISVLGTRHPIVINEAVDLAKRFCDGAAPRTINGCLRTFVKELTETTEAALSQDLNANEKLPAEV